MRIDCERCHAGFQVDESRIPDAGARAVCPRCKQQIIVKRPASLSNADFLRPPDTLPPPPLPMPGAPVPPDPLAVEPRSDVFDTGRRTTGRYALPPDPLRDAPTTGQYAVPDAAAAAYATATGRITGQFPAASESLPDLGLELPEVPVTGEFPPSIDPFDLDDPPPVPMAPAPVADEKTLPPVDDEKTLPPVGSDDDETEQPAEWRLRRAGVVEGPYTARQLLARHEAGLVGPKDQVARGDDPFQPLKAYALTAGFLQAAGKRKTVAFASVERRPPSRKPVLAVAVTVLGALAGAYVWTVRPEMLFGPAVAPADRAAMQIVDEWRDKEPRPIASAQELYQLGRGYEASDSEDGPRRALEAYRRAVMRDPGHAESMSAWAELRGLQALEADDTTGLREANELLGYALRHGGNSAAPHVARANLLAASGTASDLIVAQSEAQKARELAPGDPWVLLAVGRSFLGTNATYALEALEKANESPEVEKRSGLVMGEAYLRLGRLSDARASFEKHLTFQPDDPKAVLRLARLDAAAGLFDAARRRLERTVAVHPDAAELRLMLMQIAYQRDGDLDSAEAQLKALRSLRLSRREQVRVHVHAAAIAHARGRLEEARSLALEGLTFDSEASALHYRLASVLLELGQVEDAEKHLKKAGVSMPDRSRLAVLQGRVNAALGKLDEAQAAFARAILLSPRQASAYLLAAAMYAQVGAQSQALSLVQKALSADPSWGAAHRILTDYPDMSQPLRVAVGAMQSLASMNDGEALAHGALAMAHYHAGNVEQAEAIARRANVPGRSSVVARVYLAQILLDRRESSDAIEVLQGVVRDDRHCALAHHLYGRALSQLGRFDAAHARFREALEENPHFLPATVRDAEALAQLGRRDEAQALFDEAYQRDPEDVSVRRGLEALARGQFAPSMDGTLAVEAE